MQEEATSSKEEATSSKEEACSDGGAGAVERRAVAVARGEPPLRCVGVVHSLEHGVMSQAWRRRATMSALTRPRCA
jgi:hypothetical protein